MAFAAHALRRSLRTGGEPADRRAVGRSPTGPIDKDAAPFVAAGAVPSLIAALTGRRRSAIVLLGLPTAIALFFRDPVRRPDEEDEIPGEVVLAPADGRVTHVGAPQPGTSPDGEWQQIAIFLSVLDVHINRAPFGGRITAIDHRPGSFLAAFRPTSGVSNERTEIRVERDLGDGAPARTVIFRQIVGVLARRIVTRVGVGSEIATGERIGLMRFGSRMDVFLPPQVEVLIRAGERTVAGETVLARWPTDDG